MTVKAKKNWWIMDKCWGRNNSRLIIWNRNTINFNKIKIKISCNTNDNWYLKIIKKIIWYQHYNHVNNWKSIKRISPKWQNAPVINLSNFYNLPHDKHILFFFKMRINLTHDRFWSFGVMNQNDYWRQYISL